MATRGMRIGGGPKSAYTLSSASGIITPTGQSAGLRYGRSFKAAQGSAVSVAGVTAGGFVGVAVPNSAVRVGFNFPKPVYFDQYTAPFRDVVRLGDGFSDPTGNSLAPINVADGWPTTDFRLMLGGGPAGDYHGVVNGNFSSISYGGNGSISAVGTYDSVANTKTFTLTRNVAEWGYVNVTGTQRTSISATNSGIQGIQVLQPGDTDFASLGTRKFTDAYKALAARFNGPTRFMDFTGTNNNTQVRDAVGQSQRPTPILTRTTSTYLDANTSVIVDLWGLPDEDIVQWMQETSTDGWLCTPLGATDAYVTQMATRFLNGLTKGQTLVVEYANELWNNSTSVTSGLRDMLCVLLDGYYDSFESGGSNGNHPRRMVGCTSTGTSITMTFQTAHNRIVGDTIYINGLDADNLFSGSALVTAVPSPVSVTVNVSGHAAGTIRNNSGFTFLGKLDTGPHSLTFDGYTNVYGLASRFAMRRICQISDLWRAVWGDAAMSTRIRVAWADQQFGNPAGGELNDLWAIMTNQGGRPLGGGTAGYLTAIAGGYYSTINDADSDAINSNIIGNLNTSTNSSLTLADYVHGFITLVDEFALQGYADFEQRTCWALAFGLKHFAYEGGPDTFGDAGPRNNQLKTDAQYDISCKPAWLNLLNAYFSQGGDEFCWYHGGVKPPGYNGTFGAYEVVRDVTDRTSAKISAITDVIATGRVSLNRNIIAAGSFIDGRQDASEWLNATPPTDQTLFTRNLHCNFFDFGSMKWLGWNPNGAQTLAMTIRYTCNFAESARLIVNGVQYGGTINFSDVPADHTTVKSIGPISIPWNQGKNAIFIYPNSPGQGDDVHIRGFAF